MREEKDTKQSYRFLPQSRSSPFPLALPRRVHYNIYLITNAQTHNMRIPILNHTCKKFPMLKHISKRFLNKQNYTEKWLRLNTWYTMSGVHKYKSDKTLEFLRYESL